MTCRSEILLTLAIIAPPGTGKRTLLLRIFNDLKNYHSDKLGFCLDNKDDVWHLSRDNMNSCGDRCSSWDYIKACRIGINDVGRRNRHIFSYAHARSDPPAVVSIIVNSRDGKQLLMIKILIASVDEKFEQSKYASVLKKVFPYCAALVVPVNSIVLAAKRGWLRDDSVLNAMLNVDAVISWISEWNLMRVGVNRRKPIFLVPVKCESLYHATGSIPLLKDDARNVFLRRISKSMSSCPVNGHDRGILDDNDVECFIYPVQTLRCYRIQDGELLKRNDGWQESYSVGGVYVRDCEDVYEERSDVFVRYALRLTFGELENELGKICNLYKFIPPPPIIVKRVRFIIERIIEIEKSFLLNADFGLVQEGLHSARGEMH